MQGKPLTHLRDRNGAGVRGRGVRRAGARPFPFSSFLKQPTRVDDLAVSAVTV